MNISMREIIGVVLILAIGYYLFMLNNRFRFQSIVPFFRFSNSPSVFPPTFKPEVIKNNNTITGTTFTAKLK